MSDVTQGNAAAAPVAPTAEEVEASTKAKIAADAKAASDALHAEIVTVEASLDALAGKLHAAADKVAIEPTFESYAKSFVTDARHKVQEIHDWISRHLANSPAA